MKTLLRRLQRDLRRYFGESLVSVSLVGSAAYNVLHGYTLEPGDLDIVVVVDSEVDEDILRDVRDIAVEACRGCTVYTATSTYTHDALKRPSVYLMLYPVSMYRGISRVLRASWGKLNIPVYGPGLEELSEPRLSIHDALFDDYGVVTCIDWLRRRVFYSKTIVLEPGAITPRRIRRQLRGKLLRNILRYCWRWSAYNVLSALGVNIDPYDEKNLAIHVRKTVGVEWPSRAPSSPAHLVKHLVALASLAVQAGGGGSSWPESTSKSLSRM